jgi:hypothetical protein
MTFRFASFRPLVIATVAIVLSFCSLAATAQKYRTAAGIRLGKENFGITVQQRLFPKTTLEGIGIFRNREVSATLLAEHHFGLLGPSLNYYIGAGGHVGTQRDQGGFGGVDGILGLEYKIAFSPIVLSLDVKPSVEISNADDWFRVPTAFSVRYILWKEKKTGLFEGVFGGDKDKKKARRKDKKKDSDRRGIFNL